MLSATESLVMPQVRLSVSISCRLALAGRAPLAPTVLPTQAAVKICLDACRPAGGSVKLSRVACE